MWTRSAIWAVPTPLQRSAGVDGRSPWDAWIRSRARAADVDAFPAHITVLGRLALADAGSGTELMTTLRRVAARAEPLTLVAARPRHGPEPLKAVYLPIADAPALRELHERLARALTPWLLGSLPPFRPHLSLAYGALDASTRAQLTARADAERLAGPLRVETLALVAAGGPDWCAPGRWRSLGTAALGPPAR